MDLITKEVRMIELTFTLIVWISVYALEAKHDLNYKTIDGTEKLWDAGMFTVLHISYALMIWYYGIFWNAFLLGAISVMVRLVFHSGFINIFRGKSWGAKFTVDNDKDYWDMFLVYLYGKGIKPCLIIIGALIACILVYLLTIYEVL